MFQTKEGLMSCFVKGDTITVYKQNKKIQEIKITDTAEQIELPAQMTHDYEPLELIQNGDKLLLTAKVGSNGDNQNMIAVFSIDYANA